MRFFLVLRLKFLQLRLELAETELFNLVEKVLPDVEGDERLTAQVQKDIQRVNRKIADLDLKILDTKKKLRRLARAD